MRKVMGVICYILAGFFVYMVCLLAFVNHPSIAKWGIVAGFSIPGLLFLSVGLALNRFRSWRQHTGIVLVTGAGFTCFVEFTFVCLLMTEEFKRMMKPDTLQFFSAYVSGGTFVLITAALGITLLMRRGKDRAEPSAAGDADKPRV